jgi:CheY-like chemotaxis protein
MMSFGRPPTAHSCANGRQITQLWCAGIRADKDGVKAAIPNSQLSESLSADNGDIDILRRRVRELELLCAEVFDAAAKLGVPQPLLNRLQTVAAQRSTPHAFAAGMPPHPPAAAAPMPLPDCRVTDGRVRDPETHPNSPKPALAPVARRPRVMVVDDDPMMMEVLVRILQRENYELMVASSGAEALEKAAASAEPLELLITDYAMPGMKGHELAQRMRERYPNVRVLYQTGFSDVLFENTVQMEEGAAFLEKPFTARGLREAARVVLFGAINPTGG